MAERKSLTIADMALLELKANAPNGARLVALDAQAQAVAVATEKKIEQMRQAFGRMQEELNRLKSPEHRTGGSVIGSGHHD